jgi:DeoR family deoxyribose operon repressor
VKRQSRIDQLQEIIAQANSITIKDLADQLNVSVMTIRRDMEVLEEAGIVRTYRGGVIVSENKSHGAVPYGYSLTTAETSHVEEKRAIAQYAASLIRNSDVIFFDAGSTVELILDYVSHDIEMTAICYSLNIVNLIASWPNTRIVFAGGVYHPESQNFESPEGLQLLGRNRSSKAFISANGISANLGMTSTGQFEIPIKRLAIKNSAESYLVADSSKFGLVRTSHFADAGDFSAIITDQGIDPDLREKLIGLGTTVIVAP